MWHWELNTLAAHTILFSIFFCVHETYCKSFVFPCYLGSDLHTLILGTVVLPMKRVHVLFWTLQTQKLLLGWWGGVGFDLILMLSLLFYVYKPCKEWVGRCWITKCYLWLPESFHFFSNKGPNRTSSCVFLWSTSDTMSQCEKMDSHFCGSKSHDAEKDHKGRTFSSF